MMSNSTPRTFPGPLRGQVTRVVILFVRKTVFVLFVKIDIEFISQFMSNQIFNNQEVQNSTVANGVFQNTPGTAGNWSSSGANSRTPACERIQQTVNALKPGNKEK